MAEVLHEDVREEILEAAYQLFLSEGLKFTMDDLAGSLHKSKKTIYQFYPNKTRLLYAMVDHVFDSIKESERSYLEDTALDTPQKLRMVLSAMPDKYRDVDFGKLYMLKDKYPAIYERVEDRLESGWESTILLLETGMEEGVFRTFSIPVFKTMMQATLEQFFQKRVLIENGISYQKALREVVSILVDGIMTNSI